VLAALHQHLGDAAPGPAVGQHAAARHRALNAHRMAH
jgi:hypothetical protein